MSRRDSDGDSDLEGRDYNRDDTQSTTAALIPESPIAAQSDDEEMEGVDEEDASENEDEKVARGKDYEVKETPLDWNRVLPLMLMLLSDSFNSASIFPYVPFMIYDFGLTTDKRLIGHYAGAIASSFFLVQAFSSYFWGRMSDRYGRRPILLFGGIGTCISVAGFGLSVNYPMAVFSRSLAGLLNGNIGVVKTYLGEITDSTNQARAFGLVGMIWGIGSIAGAMIGGLTARPAVAYPWLFSDDGFFATFPYVIPNAVSACVSIISTFLGWLYLKETLVSDTSEIMQSGDDVEMMPMNSTEEGSEGDPLESVEEVDEEGRLDSNAENSSQNEGWIARIQRSLQPRAAEGVAGSETNTENDLEGGESEQHTQSQPYRILPPEERRKKWIEISSLRLSNTPSFISQIRKKKKHTIHPNRKAIQLTKRESVWKNKVALLTCVLYAMLGAVYIIYDEVVPLWAVLPIQTGGLGFDTTDLGIINAWGGFAVITVQLLVFARIAKQLGLIGSFRWGNWMSIPIMLALPWFSYIADWSLVGVWIALLGCFALRHLAGQMAFSPVMTMIVNSVDARDMGSVNGLGQSLVALTRGIAPYLAGIIFSWSATSGLPMPFDYRFCFFMMSFFVVCIIACSYLLPHYIEKPYKDQIRADSPQSATTLASLTKKKKKKIATPSIRSSLAMTSSEHLPGMA